MQKIKRWLGFLVGAAVLLALGAACQQPTPAPTFVLATPAPNIVTLEPTRNPLVAQESLVLTDFGPVDGQLRPRIQVDRAGDLHVMWLAWREGGSALLYRHWSAEAGWFDIETWKTWELGRPLQWELAVDDANIPHAVWSEPGRLFFLRRDSANSVIIDDLAFELAGDTTSSSYTTAFGFTESSDQFYLIYRDDTVPAPPYFRLAYSAAAGKDWQTWGEIMPDPASPALKTDITMAAGDDQVIHALLDAPNAALYTQFDPETETWQGLQGSTDWLEIGETAHSIALDERSFPHLLYRLGGDIQYIYWNGVNWEAPGVAFLGTSLGKPTMAMTMVEDLAWIFGDHMGGPPEDRLGMPNGLWMRVFDFAGETASHAWLVRQGAVTEIVAASSDDTVHIMVVIDGHFWHLRLPASFGAGLEQLPVSGEVPTPAPS